MHNVEELPIPSRDSVAQTTDARALGELANMAEELGEGAIAADVRQLVARINEGRFFVACVGQFKRGKSTLLGALVGEPILPMGVVPVTAVPTVLRYGSQRTARVLIGETWRTIPPRRGSRKPPTPPGWSPPRRWSASK